MRVPLTWRWAPARSSPPPQTRPRWPRTASARPWGPRGGCVRREAQARRQGNDGGGREQPAAAPSLPRPVTCHGLFPSGTRRGRLRRRRPMKANGPQRTAAPSRHRPRPPPLWKSPPPRHVMRSRQPPRPSASRDLPAFSPAPQRLDLAGASLKGAASACCVWGFQTTKVFYFIFLIIIVIIGFLLKSA